MAGEQPPRRGSYDRPRVIVAGALTGLVMLLLVMDAISPDYAVGEVTLAALLGAVLALLGIEAADVIRGGRE